MFPPLIMLSFFFTEPSGTRYGHPQELDAGVYSTISQLANQRQIILRLFGFSLIETTLLGCVDGIVESACPFSGNGTAEP